MTFDDFIKKYSGKGVDYDGVYGYQCVDLYRFYCKEVLQVPQSPPVPGAADIWDSYLPAHFERIANTPEGIPQKGDIVIWSNKAGGGFGHVAIFYEGTINKFTSYDQNWPTGSLCHLQGHYYTNVLGWLRPKQPMDELKDLLAFLKVKDVPEAKQVWTKEMGYLEDEREAKQKLEKEIVELKPKSQEWDKVLVAFHEQKVANFVDLDRYIRSLTVSSTPQSQLLKEEKEKCVKRIDELKDQHEVKVALLKSQLVNPKSMTISEIGTLLVARLREKLSQGGKA